MYAKSRKCVLRTSLSACKNGNNSLVEHNAPSRVRQVGQQALLRSRFSKRASLSNITVSQRFLTRSEFTSCVCVNLHRVHHTETATIDVVALKTPIV